MSEAYNTRSIDTGLQVRLMNLVLGEASDFERDQLQLLIGQRTELADYYRHLEHLHGFLCEVGEGEPMIDVEQSTAENAWQLSAVRREQLLAVLDGKKEDLETKVILANPKRSMPQTLRSNWVAIGVMAAAACVLFGLMLPAVQSHRIAESRMKTSNSLYYLNDDIQHFPVRPDTSEPSYRNRITGKTNELDGRSIPDDVAAYVPSASHPSALDSRFSRRIAQTPTTAVEGWIKSGGVQASDNTETKLRANEGMDASRVWDAAGAKPGGMDSMAGRHGVVASELSNGLSSNSAGLGSVSGSQLGTSDRNRNESLAFDFMNQPQSGARSAIDNFSSQIQAEKAVAIPAKPNSHWNDDGIANRLGDLVESPKSEVTLWERNDSGVIRTPAEVAQVITTVSEPDGGSILLGGIKKLRETPQSGQLNRLFRNFNGQADNSPTLMMTVTPRIIIPEEEEEALSAGGVRGSTLVDNSESLDLVATLQEKESKGDWAKDSRGEPADAKNLAENVTSEMLGKFMRNLREEDIVKQKEPFQQNTDYFDDARIKKLSILESTENAERRIAGSESLRENKSGNVSLGWMFRPAPAPEIASKDFGNIKSDSKLASPQQPAMLDEQSAAADAFSTFSLHVSDVSFKLAQAALSHGQWPEAAKIRIEEFVNALDYHDPLPSGNQKIACRVEQAIHPFLMQRNLLRVSMRTAATGRSQNTPLRLTILLDNSGSMERPDRRQAVLRAFQNLTQQLSANDQITLISFASTPRLLADKVPGNEGAKLLQLVETLPSEGGTNIEAALLLAREKAAEQQLASAQNRIVMLTDGAVNLGNADPDSLAKLVTQMRDAGIAFDAAGISAQDLNDDVLEALTRQGDGRYYLLDSAAAAGESFAAQIAGALRPSAQNVKVQVEFNPKRVGRYKLLGFEKHRLNREDFRNDQVDAAEMAAAEAGVAVYQFEAKPNGSGDVGSVSVRFRDLSTDQMVERRWPILYESNTPRLEQAQASMQLAASAALFAVKLSGGALADITDLTQLQYLLAKLPERIASQPRVQQLRAMIEQALAIH